MKHLEDGISHREVIMLESRFNVTKRTAISQCVIDMVQTDNLIEFAKEQAAKAIIDEIVKLAIDFIERQSIGNTSIFVSKHSTRPLMIMTPKEFAEMMQRCHHTY